MRLISTQQSDLFGPEYWPDTGTFRITLQRKFYLIGECPPGTHYSKSGIDKALKLAGEVWMPCNTLMDFVSFFDIDPVKAPNGRLISSGVCAWCGESLTLRFGKTPWNGPYRCDGKCVYQGCEGPKWGTLHFDCMDRMHEALPRRGYVSKWDARRWMNE